MKSYDIYWKFQVQICGSLQVGMKVYVFPARNDLLHKKTLEGTWVSFSKEKHVES